MELRFETLRHNNYIRKSTFSFMIILCSVLSEKMHGQHIPFSGNHSLTKEECVAEFKKLDDSSEMARLRLIGKSDGGNDLHLFVINKEGVFYPELFNRKKTIIFVNNDIHAGEPDGVDACVMLCKELLNEDSEISSLLDSVIICVVPMYNVDGAMNRGKYHRANQAGPEEYGMRANALNLDLNRDFIKCDSRNARIFNSIFTAINPNIFIDTHVSDGADYPYTMTLISTQADKLGGTNGKFLKEELEPALFQAMKNKNEEMCPYVNTMGATPETGIAHFLETPRYATGYAALFNTIGFTTETHMLKLFPRRVESTYLFLVSLLEYVDNHSAEIVRLKSVSDNEMLQKKSMALAFALDTSNVDLFDFSGYEAKTKKSNLGEGERLYYDHLNRWEKKIPYFRNFKPINEVVIPDFYILPQAWERVIERLKCNGVIMNTFQNDTMIEVQSYKIVDYKSPEKPYEGHFLHTNIKVESGTQMVLFHAGDFFISTNQRAKRYLVETLEPQSEDGFFAWNFFDSVLQQKEWFSDYVFEDKAEELLRADPKLKSDFEDALKQDPLLKENHWNQLYWIYRHSPYYELTVNRYPVYRKTEKEMH